MLFSSRLSACVLNQIYRMPRKARVAASKFQVPAGPRKQMAQFIRKLVELLETAPEDVVSWTRNGTAFRVHNQKAFASVLGKHFRSNQLNNFVRQLNFYAFQKLNAPGSSGSLEFSHPLFRRGQWDTIQQIKRKTSSEFHVTYEHELKALRETADSLRSTVADLKAQLSSALASCESLRTERDQSAAHAAAVTDVATQLGVKLPAELVAAVTHRLAASQGRPAATSTRYKAKQRTLPTTPTLAPVRSPALKRKRSLPQSAPGGDSGSPSTTFTTPSQLPSNWGHGPSSDMIFSLFEGDPVGDFAGGLLGENYTTSDYAGSSRAVPASTSVSTPQAEPVMTSAPATRSMATNVASAPAPRGLEPQGGNNANMALDSALNDLSWLDSSDPLGPPSLSRGISLVSVDAIDSVNSGVPAVQTVTAPAHSPATPVTSAA